MSLFLPVLYTRIFLPTAVILLNVQDFFSPLRTLIQNGVREGFIQPHNEGLITFVDGPADVAEQGSFDWGVAALSALDEWRSSGVKALYDWTKSIDDRTVEEGDDGLGSA
jgi:hypothetical protein